MSVRQLPLSRFQLYHFHTDLDDTLPDESKLFGCSPLRSMILTGKEPAIIYSDNNRPSVFLGLSPAHEWKAVDAYGLPSTRWVE